MADDQRIVRIDVSKELLKRFGRPPLKSTKDYLDRVDKQTRLVRPWFASGSP